MTLAVILSVGRGYVGAEVQEWMLGIGLKVLVTSWMFLHSSVVT